MKHQRERIATVVGLVLGVVVMAGMVNTDAYMHAASAEARGYQALFTVGAAR